MIRRGTYLVSREESDRRKYDRTQYYSTQEPTTIVERVNENNTDEQQQSSSGFKWLSNSTLLSIMFAIITSVGGFVFKLYERTNTLEYRQASIIEKMAEIKKFDEDNQNSIKEVEKTQLKINEHISSIEQTMMELYRSSQKR